VGFDNLPGSDYESAFGGVNVLTFIASNDDCSEGFYSPALADLSEDDADRLSEAIVTEQSCGARAADDYLGFDADLANDAAFQAALDNRTNDKQDFILAFVHVQHGDEQKAPPRRLEAARHAALSRGLKTHWIEVKLPQNATPEIIVEKMASPRGFSSVTQSMESRNRLQVCLPLGVSLDAADGEPTPTIGKLLQHEGGGPSEKTVAKHCHVLVATRPTASVHSGAASYSAVARYPQKFWHLGTDTDRLLGCDPGWIVELDADILMSEVGFEGEEFASSTVRDAYLQEKIDLWLACDPERRHAPLKERN
jgi:hypothetical protein